MPIIECKFTPKQGGAQFTVNNLTNYSIRLSRPTAENGAVGMRGHDIGGIKITRRKSLHDGGVAKIEDDTIKLAAATEQKAYFKGEITLARDDDASDKIQTIRWDTGHICDYSTEVSDAVIIEYFEVSVMDLKIDDVEVKRVQTT